MQCHSIFSFGWNYILAKSIHIFHQLIVINGAQKHEAQVNQFHSQ